MNQDPTVMVEEVPRLVAILRKKIRKLRCETDKAISMRELYMTLQINLIEIEDIIGKDE